ncbi:hypothetical protein Pyn_13918 [Prunus yedoensis var. nudiflora]|uniref:Uncharacterized protein n=1 Tax=Prunus yedoensis var. nudiflora TaxID=2094558 RepID=A0A314V0H9_PRUYE|nr:hypothetical protein Pyn_13918 [Prunus yedoensis var. nudiflora]
MGTTPLDMRPFVICLGALGWARLLNFLSAALPDNNTHIISLRLHSLSKRLSDPSLLDLSSSSLHCFPIHNFWSCT